MHVQALRQALRELSARTATSSDRLTHRVATRWLRAGLTGQYDVMLRLQVLEGAAKVPPRTWWDKGERGLALALSHFSETGSKIDPSWFSKKNTGAIDTTLARLSKITANSAGLEPLDVIHSALFGIPLDPSLPRENVIKLYAVGETLRKGILEGLETPLLVMRGLGGRYLFQFALGEIKALSLNRAPGNLGANYPAPPLDPRGLWDHLASWWLDKNDPLGAALRQVMKSAWANMKPQGPGMDRWLDESVKRGDMIGTGEAIKLLGVQASVWNQVFLKPAFARVVGALKQQPKLLKEIEHRLLLLGYNPEDLNFGIDHIPNPEDLNPKRLPGGTRPVPKFNIF